MFQSDVDNFIRMEVWKQIVEDVLGRALLLSEDNDVLDPVQNVVVIARNQGEIKALKWIADLPKLYMEEIESKKEEEKENGKQS